jgi:hypothetical protein
VIHWNVRLLLSSILLVYGMPARTHTRPPNSFSIRAKMNFEDYQDIIIWGIQKEVRCKFPFLQSFADATLPQPRGARPQLQRAVNYQFPNSMSIFDVFSANWNSRIPASYVQISWVWLLTMVLKQDPHFSANRELKTRKEYERNLRHQLARNK